MTLEPFALKVSDPVDSDLENAELAIFIGSGPQCPGVGGEHSGTERGGGLEEPAAGGTFNTRGSFNIHF